uniref:DUF6570 domain-containing protein n=1 Tax=Panagrellus redivivus TaxID=6233 RepID=A0A7E4V838_PANRE
LVTLTDKAGRKTKVIATRGALVVLPVPTNGTMKHVAETLPSAANLNILVKTDHGRRIVSLPRVLRALHWLKANNDLYKDIVIDDQFRFSLTGVHFDKAAPTQADCDALIEFNDGTVNTILQHDDIQHQAVMDTNDADPDGTS